MKIDIHITEATEEEARKFFSWNETVRAADHLLSTMMEGAKQELRSVDDRPAQICPLCKAPLKETTSGVWDCPDCKTFTRFEKGRSVPDPQPGQTGCETCDCTGFDECDKCSPPPEKKKRGPQRGNKYGIPVELYRTDKREYGRLWALCKAHGLTYEQALVWKRLPSRTKGDGKQGKKMGRQPLATTPDKHDPHSSAGQQKIRELVAAKNGELRAGQAVKHNGPRASPFFGKEGKIVKIGSDGQVFVDFGTSSTWLVPHNLMVVPEVTA